MHPCVVPKLFFINKKQRTAISLYQERGVSLLATTLWWCSCLLWQAKDGRVGARPNHDDKEKDVPAEEPDEPED